MGGGMIDIDKLRELSNADTPGPWNGERGELLDCVNLIRIFDRAKLDYEVLGANMKHDDIRFCAAARTALPEALDEIVRLRDENGRIKLDLDTQCDINHDRLQEVERLRAALQRIADRKYFPYNKYEYNETADEIAQAALKGE